MVVFLFRQFSLFLITAQAIETHRGNKMHLKFFLMPGTGRQSVIRFTLHTVDLGVTGEISSRYRDGPRGGGLKCVSPIEESNPFCSII